MHFFLKNGGQGIVGKLGLLNNLDEMFSINAEEIMLSKP